MYRKNGGTRLVPYLLVVFALAIAFAGCGGDSETTTTAAAATTTTAGSPSDGGASDGAALYSANCASCHGDGGEGGVGPDLRGEDNVTRIEEQVTNGGGAMPAFGGTLSAEEISALATYVVGLE